MGSIETILSALLGLVPTPTAEDGFVGFTTGDFGSTITPGGISPL